MPIYSGDIPHCPQLLDYQGNVSQYSIDLAVYLENWLGAYSQDIRNILTEQDFLEYLSSFDDTAVIYAGTGGALSDDVANFLYNSTTHALTITGAFNCASVVSSGAGSFTDLTLSAPVNVYNLDHNSFVNGGGNQHIDWTNAGVSLLTTGNISGAYITGLTGGYLGGLSFASGSITDASGAISFGDENLSHTGTLSTAGLAVTTTATATVLIHDNGNDIGGGNIQQRTSRGGAASQNNDYCGFFSWQFYDSGNNLTTAADIYAQVIDVTNLSEDANLIWREMVAGSLTEIMRFKAGKVGIGDSNPSEKLSVSGNISASGTMSGSSGSTFGGNKVPKKLYVSAQLFIGTAALANPAISYELDPTDYVIAYLRIPDYINDSQDIKITFTVATDTEDATDLLIYVGSWPTDGTDDGDPYDVENGTATNFGTTLADCLTKYTYTLTAANYSINDLIGFAFWNNEGAAVMQVFDCVFEMVAKDS